jgi:hypothetical protein
MNGPTKGPIRIKALIAGLAIGASTWAAVAIANDVGPKADGSPNWPAPGEVVTDADQPPPDAIKGEYAHIGSPASEEVLSECRDKILQGIAPVGLDEITPDDVLDCKALLAAADGRLSPGDYTHAELEQAVQAASEKGKR